ncbi:MAG: hypothetical protein HGA79_11095 [Anaerolineales bacterium]|nr:hypothetical protein [Anaerolineales bacterium]
MRLLAAAFVLSLLFGSLGSARAQGQAVADFYPPDVSAFPIISAQLDVFDATGAFACPDGVYDVSYHESGYDAVEYIASTVEGAFADTGTMDAVLKIMADCDGADCASVGTMYGDDFEYGCTAVAPFSGAWVGPP